MRIRIINSLWFCGSESTFSFLGQGQQESLQRTRMHATKVANPFRNRKTLGPLHRQNIKILKANHKGSAAWRRGKVASASRYSHAGVASSVRGQDVCRAGYLLCSVTVVLQWCYSGVRVVILSRKQWQPAEHINYQEHHNQPTRTGVDCWSKQGSNIHVKKRVF